jgi:AcrR family transcriptional regulator
MRESTELKETILREAEDLFSAQGFAGTSIKQIATASGCTTAALYYYFPEGKAQLLREVVHCAFAAKTNMVAEAGHNAASLGEWLRAFGNAAMQSLIEMQRRKSWLELEMHQLGASEHAALQQHSLAMQRSIAKEIARFTGDQAQANRLAWMLLCAVFGYGRLFLSRGPQQVAEFDTAAFVETIVATVGCTSQVADK